MPAVVALLAIIVFVLFVVAGTGLKIVRPFEKGLVERLGRYRETLDPGLRWIIPFVERIIKVDMRE